VCTSNDACRFAKVSELFVYENFMRVPADTVEAGDICAVCGISDVMVSIFYLIISAMVALLSSVQFLTYCVPCRLVKQ
jgi:predicted membrane GTPase involved in stress response